MTTREDLTNLTRERYPHLQARILANNIFDYAEEQELEIVDIYVTPSRGYLGVYRRLGNASQKMLCSIHATFIDWHHPGPWRREVIDTLYDSYQTDPSGFKHSATHINCPGCNALLPKQLTECELCGQELPPPGQES